jgi:putative transposase
MKKSKFTEEQILLAPKQAGAGHPVCDLSRQMGASEATFYVWRKRYGNLGLLKVRELRQLRDENVRVKRLVADLTPDRHILQEVVKKRFSSRSSTRHCTMGSGLLSTKRAASVPTDRAPTGDLVLPVSSARSERAAPEDSRVGHGETQIRVLASAYLAEPRGLASRAEQGSPAVQAGGPPSPHESPSQEAHQSASRAGATGVGSGAILGNGFRARRSWRAAGSFEY